MLSGDGVTFWDSPEYHAYEVACGEAPGTRSRLLADATWQTRVIDLSLSEAELWRGVRKSYRSLIHRAEREYRIEATDDDEGVRVARLIHREAAGRETRSAATWAMMADWVRHERGSIVTATNRTSGEAYGYVYAARAGAWSYYFSAASCVRDVNHALLWHAMLALKARGVRWFELGWLERAGDTAKDRHISFLKSGLGGHDIPAKEAPLLCGS